MALVRVAEEMARVDEETAAAVGEDLVMDLDARAVEAMVAAVEMEAVTVGMRGEVVQELAERVVV